MDLPYLLKKLREHTLHYSEQERAAEVLSELVWTCKIRALGRTDPPQDCDWPNCGCDPHANRVLEHLDECGFEIVPMKPLALNN